MAFAGRRGVSLNVDLLVTEGDGISRQPRRVRRFQELGRAGVGAPQALTPKALFNEELGVVLQVRAPTATR